MSYRDVGCRKLMRWASSRLFRLDKNFPPAAEINPEYQKSLIEKWKKELVS